VRGKSGGLRGQAPVHLGPLVRADARGHRDRLGVDEHGRLGAVRRGRAEQAVGGARGRQGNRAGSCCGHRALGQGHEGENSGMC